MILLLAVIMPFASRAANKTLATGSFIINMGAANPKTIANGLKSYGLIYDLIKNYKIPAKVELGHIKIVTKTAHN